MNVGIYGGTFNPPHIAHLIVAETVRDQFGFDHVLWIPSGRPPHKPGSALAPAAHRLQMTRLATQDNPGFQVSEIEMQGGVSYTVDTVRTLQERQPDVSFSLILGGDSLLGFSSWHRPEEILARVPLVVYHRPGSEAAELEPRLAGRVQFTRAPLLEVSGEAIRARCRQGRSIRYLVPDPVLAYIEAQALYLE